jgi:hypothetical protein
MPRGENDNTIHCFLLHFIITIIGVDFVKKVLFRVFYHPDLIVAVNEVASQRISVKLLHRCMGI